MQVLSHPYPRGIDCASWSRGWKQYLHSRTTTLQNSARLPGGCLFHAFTAESFVRFSFDLSASHYWLLLHLLALANIANQSWRKWLAMSKVMKLLFPIPLWNVMRWLHQIYFGPPVRSSATQLRMVILYTSYCRKEAHRCSKRHHLPLTKHLPVTRSRQNPFRDSKNKVDRAGAPTCQWQVMTVMWWTLEIYDLWPDMIRPVAHHGWKAPWATRREHSILRDWASRFQPAPSRTHEKVSLDGRAPQSNTNFANVRFIIISIILWLWQFNCLGWWAKRRTQNAWRQKRRSWRCGEQDELQPRKDILSWLMT